MKTLTISDLVPYLKLINSKLDELIAKKNNRGLFVREKEYKLASAFVNKWNTYTRLLYKKEYKSPAYIKKIALALRGKQKHFTYEECLQAIENYNKVYARDSTSFKVTYEPITFLRGKKNNHFFGILFNEENYLLGKSKKVLDKALVEDALQYLKQKGK